MTKPVPLLASICVCLVLSGCNVASKNPLSNPNASKIDIRLLGVWRGTDEKNGDVIYYHVGLADDEEPREGITGYLDPTGLEVEQFDGKLPGGMLRIVGITHKKDFTLNDPGELLAFSTNLKGADYLNLIFLEETKLKTLKENGWKNPESYIITKYKIDGDKLRIWGMESSAVKKAVESKQLAGEIHDDKSLTGVKYTITAPTADLARYVAESGDSLFSKEAFVLERVK
jgi:hypothetical protein